MIVVGGSPRRYADRFRRFDVVGQVDTTSAMPYETHQPIYGLRDSRTPLKVFWPQLKRRR
jgi:hypothetical protein